MENGQTQLAHTPKSDYAEPVTVLDLTAYNKKQIDLFDAEQGVTPIPSNKSGRELLGEPQYLRSRKTSIDDVYFEPTFTSTEFQTALRLLATAIAYCESAITAARFERWLESDDAVHHIQNLLPELFCCRNLSESFAAIVNSIKNAFANNRAQPLNEDKLLALREILTAVRNEPFMNFNKGIDLIMAFEDHNFHVEPVGLDLLMGLEELLEEKPDEQ